LGRTDRDNTNSGARLVTFTHSADCHDPVCPEIIADARDVAVLARYALHDIDGHAECDPSDCTVSALRLAIPTRVFAAAIRHGDIRAALATDANLLGRAIREHRQAEFDPHAVISMTHLCFDDCAENIAARYDELAAR
jgi:hypothetical protein